MNKVSKGVSKDLRTIRKLDKRQEAFTRLWMSPSSSSFGNAYDSALRAGYKESVARVITGNARNMPWVQEAKELFASQLDNDHIVMGLQKEALSADAPRDRIRALELMAKIKGMFIERSQQEISVNFVNSVPRPEYDTPYVVPKDTIDGETVAQQGSHTSHNE